MRAVLLALLTLALGTADAQQWQLLQTGTNETLYGVCCVDEETVFAFGSGGVILKTSDGGASWTELYNEPGVEWYEMRFVGNTGFALGSDWSQYKGKLLKTTDGGLTWENKDYVLESISSMSHFECNLFMVDADTLYIAYRNLLKSTDGGNAFSIAAEELCLSETRLYFEDNVGYICEGEIGNIVDNLRILKSVDYGNTWDIAFENDKYGYGKPLPHFLDKDRIDLFGETYLEDWGCSDVLRTEDGFSTYEYGWTGWLYYDGIILDGKFNNQQNGMLLLEDNYPIGRDYGTYTARTHDGGDTWEFYVNAGLAQSVNALSIDGIDTTYYVTTYNGLVYKWGRQVTQEVGEALPSTGLFPNPATSQVTVTAENISRAEIRNLLGQKVASVDGNDGGSLTIDLSGLAKGVYLVTVWNKEGADTTKKLVVE